MMAVAEIRPDWTIGTLNLTAGSVEFTTNDSLLQTAAIQPGDEIITASGLILIIASITGQNAGTLMEPCPADAAGSDQPLRIRFQPDGSRYNGAAADLVQRLSSGNVYSLSGLDGSAGGVPVFTGPGTMEVVPESEVGIPDPHGTLSDLAELDDVENLSELAKLVLAADKVLTTGDTGDLELSSLGALGRALIALESGTSAQYIQGDGSVAELNASAVGLGDVNNTSDASKPISTATQTALNTKFNNTGGQITGNIIMKKNVGRFEFVSPATANGYVLQANISDTVDGGLGVLRFGAALVEFTGNPSLKVTGNATVSGTLSKAGGTFDIDHPSDPFNKNLRHGFVESTEYLNLYRGSVDLENGRMTVDIDAAFGMTDGTFADLNEPNEVVVFLQTQFGPDRVWIEAPVDNGKFTIISESENSTATIGWMVTARRNDPFVRNIDENCERGTGRFIPEYEKEGV